MPSNSGYIYTCDRCGSEKFLKDQQGKVTRHPDDWLFYDRNKCLCSDCATTYRKFMTWFFDKGQCADEWREKE